MHSVEDSCHAQLYLDTNAAHGKLLWMRAMLLRAMQISSCVGASNLPKISGTRYDPARAHAIVSNGSPAEV